VHVGHLAALGEPVDDEGVQRVGVRHGDVQQEVVATRAVTLGATVAGLAGADLVDADGEVHPGLFEKGLPVLGAARDALPDLRLRALAAGVGVIDIPAVGQQTNDYDDVRAYVARTATADLEYLGLALHGSRRAVSRVTGTLRLLGRSSPSASPAA
jgi:hypothetical protein